MSLQRLEPGVCFDEHVSLPKLRRLWLDPASPGAAVGAPLVHVVREPLDVCISAYLYHLHSRETWLRQPRKDLKGVSIQQALRTSDTRTGLFLECRRSIRDQIAQQAEVYMHTRRHARALTLRMEATQADFDGTMRALFTFLLAPAGAGASATTAKAEEGAASGQVAALVRAASKFDVSRHRSDMDDGHLSSLDRKRHLRAALLNESRMALELAQWRASVGYDRAYRVHCQRYGLLFHLQLEEDGVRLPTAVEAEAEAVKNFIP